MLIKIYERVFFIKIYGDIDWIFFQSVISFYFHFIRKVYDKFKMTSFLSLCKIDDIFISS